MTFTEKFGIFQRMSITIVETPTEKTEFLDKWNNHPSVVIPVWEDLEKHPLNNQLSFLYIWVYGGEYIVPINHIDCINQTIDLSTSEEVKFAWNKKGILQTNLHIKNLKDIQAHTFFTYNKIIENFTENQQILSFYQKMGVKDDLGKIAPITKWVEIIREFKNNLPTLGLDNGRWVDDEMIPLLADIERGGIGVDRDKLLQRWSNSEKHIVDTKLYTEYNPYTITSRPSNRHGGINFAALNKQDGSRECFVPTEGNIFIQFDYDAYHPRIIGKLINYDLPQTSVHQWLADQYGVDYDEGKGITFKILYGGVPTEYKSIEFFREVDQFITKFGNESRERGYIQTQKGRKIPIQWIENPNDQKLFNYLLQATETELNISVLSNLKESTHTLPILYTYDSFLFEFDVSMGKEIILDIKNKIEMYNFPTKMSWGTDYSKL